MTQKLTNLLLIEAPVVPLAQFAHSLQSIFQMVMHEEYSEKQVVVQISRKEIETFLGTKLGFIFLCEQLLETHTQPSLELIELFSAYARTTSNQLELLKNRNGNAQYD